MKKLLIPALLATAFGIAAAQSATPVTPVSPAAPVATTPPVNTPSPKVEADKTVEHGDRMAFRAQHKATKQERSQLKADRAAGNTAAMKTDREALKSDKTSLHTDHQDLKAAHDTTHEQRGATKRKEGE